MKNEKGITILSLIVTLTILAIIGLTIFYTATGIDENVEDDVLIAELETIHHIILQEYNKKLTLSEYEYKGTTLLATPKYQSIIDYKDEFVGSNIYEINKENLNDIGAKNVKSRYWVCYETGEVLNIDYIKSNGEVLYTK